MGCVESTEQQHDERPGAMSWNNTYHPTPPPGSGEQYAPPRPPSDISYQPPDVPSNRYEVDSAVYQPPTLSSYQPPGESYVPPEPPSGGHTYQPPSDPGCHDSSSGISPVAHFGDTYSAPCDPGYGVPEDTYVPPPPPED